VSIGQWKQTEEKADDDGSGECSKVYHQTGGLDFGESNHVQLNHVIEAANIVGFEYQVLSAAQLREKFPALRGVPDSYKAVYEENAGILDAERAVDMFHRLCRQSTRVTCDIHSNERIVHIEEEEKEKNRVSITTSLASYTSKKLVLTCGAWIPTLVKQNFQIDLKLEVRRQSYYFWRVNKQFESEFKQLPIYIHWGASPYDNVSSIEDRMLDWGFYGFRGSFEKEGYVKVAIHEALAEEKGIDPKQRALDIDQNTEPRVPERKVEILRSFLSKLFPADSLDPETYDEMYDKGNIVTCMYTCHPTDEYVVDKLPGSNNIIIGSPCSGHGFKNAPIVADFLVELVTEEQASDKFLGQFDRQRFSLRNIIV